jgi:hypothetical protein
MYFNFIAVYIEIGHFKFGYTQTIHIVTEYIKHHYYKKVLNNKFISI